ncbi:hypothetical protein [Paraburkholderia sediminicola]|uniref:hypothetical protein n=1 Tax=Paraburkholderia sediminicola TaxID=458836 RepID=UPI0038B80691
MADQPNPARDASKSGVDDARFRYGILVFRFRDYLHAVKNLNDAVESAASSKELVLRDFRTGLRVDAWQAPTYKTAGEWERALLMCDDQLAQKTLAQGVHMAFQFPPNVVVALAEIDTWALAKGITSPGELQTLLDENWARYQHLDRDPAKAELTPAVDSSSASPASADEHTPERAMASATSGDVPSVRSPYEPGITKREQQIRAIESKAMERGYICTSVPDGGKTELMKACKGEWPKWFPSDDAFNGAWKDAGDRLRMTNHDKWRR